MAAPAFKLTMLFALTDDQFSTGWSESWYTNETIFSVAQSTAQDVITYRRRILVSDANIRAYRLSMVQPKAVAPFKRNQRASQLFENPVGGQYGSTLNIADLPWTGVFVRFTGTDNFTEKFVAFHGIPDTFFLNNKSAIPGDWKGFLSGYTRVLRNGNWGIRHKIRTNPVTYNVVYPAVAEPERNCSHRVGRPFGLLRGRKFAHQS